MKRLGYRIVAYSRETGFRTLAEAQPVAPEIGGIEMPPGAGLFLGTSRRFCEDYYTGLTDDDDVLLTYAYNEADLISGLPDGTRGEVTVRRARLVGIENLTCPDADMLAAMRPVSPRPGR